MESSSPWDDIGPESESKEPSFDDSAPESIPISAGFSSMQNGAMLTGMAEMPPGQMIFLGPPSSAPKVVGILCTLWGVFLLGSSALNVIGAFGYTTSQPVLLSIYVVGLAAAAATELASDSTVHQNHSLGHDAVVASHGRALS